VTETCGTDPVRWWCLDGAVEPLSGPVPPADHPVWEVGYDNDCERG
jgi:hypothetical protein